MKYQQYIIGKCITEEPPNWDLRVFYVQVAERDGKRVVCGKPIEQPYHEADAGTWIIEYEGSDICPTQLANITPPATWQLLAQFPLPDNYVPESQEVRDEHKRRAIEHLKKMGVWRD